MTNYSAQKHGDLLIVQFKGRPTRYEVIISTQEALKTLSQYNFSKSIVDTRNLEILFPMSMNWFRNTWYPKAIHSGLRTLAIVVPQAFLNGLNMDAAAMTNAYTSRSGIEIHFFTDFQEAEQWVNASEVCRALSA